MCDRSAFLHAITAAPDDDLPRLIFADWLDEHGDVDRAEFIRLQCAAAESSADFRRMAALETKNRPGWVGALRSGVFQVEFRRGFVEHAVMPAAAFLKHGVELRRQTPLRGVTLLGARRVLPELVRGLHLAGLSALHLTGCRLGDHGVRLLVNSTALTGLKVLRLGDNVLGDTGVTSVARSRHLARLMTLVLRDNAIGDEGAWELAHSPCLDRLTTLDVSGNEIGASGSTALQSVARWTNLVLTDQRPMARWGRRRALTAAR
jgi:uncharacterized protein (TIGR02996 family)